MKETELKPCSCGCEAELVDSQAFSWCDVTYYVRCTNPDCDERTELKYEHKIDAINAWNKKQEFLLPLMPTDKEKQIEEMAEIIAQNTEYDTMWNEIYDSAEALYNAGYRKQEWISVDERLPEHYENCLFYLDNEIMEIGWYTEVAKTFIVGGLVTLNSVTHWIPLPEAPKMRKEDEGK